jgi:hypothetical protein
LPEPCLNPDHHDGKPATNRLSYGKAQQPAVSCAAIWRTYPHVNTAIPAEAVLPSRTANISFARPKHEWDD